ncbi:LysM peptidoglycan-binding domain-containing protein [Luteolibacter sp. AS25]|uniref:LysM peptidoglycan-binding domain-containing protein n=1 Tax=Luteolibacter sp. AS25 TaxID=3135776 RepID=UPI00398A7309
MKFERINTRRKPVRKTVYARVFNKTKPKKQRAAAAASSADDVEEGGINISRSLTIIFAIHIVAIGMIFIHKQYLSERTTAPASEASANNEEVSNSTEMKRVSVLKDGDKTMIPKKGDNYEIIASRYGIAESDLRNANPGIAVRPGAVLRIPQGRRIVAEVPPEVEAIRHNNIASQSDQGLVEIGPRIEAPKPQVVRPLSQEEREAPKAQVVSSGRTHVIKSGDNIWRISNQYKVSQQAVLSLNNISDPTKLKIGQVIKLP